MKNKHALVGALVAFSLAIANGAELSVRFAKPVDEVVVEARDLGQGRIGTILFSDDLNHWFPVFSTDRLSLSFSEPAIVGQRYFQLLETAPPKLSASSNWKMGIALPEDSFLVEFEGAEGGWLPPGTKTPKETQWTKFTVLLDDLTTVYFQNGNRLKFHYEFGTKFVPEFGGMTHMQFDGVTLYTAGRRAVIGAVLFSEKNSEYGIQFVGQDRLPAPMVRFLWQLVDNAIDKPNTLRGLYTPTHEQSDVTGEVSIALAAIDVPVVSAHRWETGSDVVYSKGWAMGRLVFVEKSEIASAFRAGELTNNDILLTDYVPAEIPRLAGIIALNPSTPNSHVAILSKNFGVPFYYEGDEATRIELRALDGRTVMFRTKAGGGINQSQNDSARVVALEDDLPKSVIDAVVNLKVPQDLKFEAKKTSGVYTKPLQSVKPSDMEYVGGKAAKFNLLRKYIPNNSPDPAIAITFDLWDEFIAQRLPNGKSLREEIDERLAKAHESDLQSELEGSLKSIRKLIRDGVFIERQRQSIIAALEPFDKDRKVRFRSSTNIEDSRHFTGAGLYDSYSGCLLDDLDDDQVGPCACDPTKPKEHGVFRAIKRVYASFYNDNAYLERRRFNVDENEVGMAILVHHSFPDEIELANGV
ncbi:MAG: PEP/pyruvate-binding domain-containing protein, partial [Verrucomicrobiota bacterium]|nr:PEP/pyruvate-binding domain-containing protein [Verrucomicrobiota bacterium]